MNRRGWVRTLSRGEPTSGRSDAGTVGKVFKRPLIRVLLSVGALASVALSASVARAGAGYIPTHRPVRSSPLNTRAKYLVLIVLDGARPDYFNLVKLPHLDALAAAGTQYTQAFTGILESETPTGHATISTGSSPRRSGILGFSWAENDKNFSLFSPAVVRAGVMERIMEQAHAPTIAGLYKARFPGNLVVALSGHKYYAADPLGGPSADDIMYFRSTLQNTYQPTAIPGHVPPWQLLTDPSLTVPLSSLKFGQDDSMVTQLAINSFELQHQHITLINYPDFDWPLGHVYGGLADRSQVIGLMQEFDYDLGRIEDAYRKAGILKKTLFVITADHGMATINRFVPGTVVDNAIQRAGTAATSITRNTATYVWLRDMTKSQAVATNIMKANDPGIQSTYYLASIKGAPQYVRAPGPALNPNMDAANRYLLDTLINGHEPAVVAFSRKGNTMSASTTHWKADHGGTSWGVQHIPLIIAGPGIKRGFVSSLPATLEDIAPTVLVSMGVRPIGMEGSVLTEAQTLPYNADQHKRSVEIARTSPLVQGMIAQDQLESGTKH